MTTFDVSSAAELQSILASAKAGDVISLSAGDYGDVTIKGKNFAQDVTITSADPAHEASFHSLNVQSSSGLDFSGVTVNLVPTASTVSFSAAVKIANSSDITFSGGHVNSGAAITGVAATATKLDGTGNVIGMDTARGVDIEGSSNVTVKGVEIDHLYKGVTIGSSTGVTVSDNNIHDVRTSTIDAAADNNLVIDGNTMSNSHPWNTGNGDHADFIHIWTDPSLQTGASNNIQITNNTMSQGDGVAPLGIYLDDNAHGLGFTNVTIQGNVILNGAGQGVRLENTSQAVVDNNTLLQTSGTPKNAPGIIVADGSHDVDVSGNVTSYASNSLTGVLATANIHDNTIVQAADPTAAGYYSSAVLNQVETLTSTTGAEQYVLANVGVQPIAAAFVMVQGDVNGAGMDDFGIKPMAVFSLHPSEFIF